MNQGTVYRYIVIAIRLFRPNRSVFFLFHCPYIDQYL